MSSDFDQRGQNVQGDQYNIAGNLIQQRLDPADLRNQRNHAVLRQAVRRFWIDGVLKGSLYNEVRIRLDLDSRPKVVDNRPWKLTLHQTGQPDRTIVDDKEIVEIFDEMCQQLLILGESGSGKTTTLLTLADDLLNRAEKDPTLPTPVVFNLSSWAEKQPKLEEWLVNELKIRYQIPSKVAKGWVENDELLLLLDGLDEVAEAKRNACVNVINAFRHEQIVGMAVCSRTTEYAVLTEQLKLTGAVAVRPLTMEQIDAYIEQVGFQVSALKQALVKSDELCELAQTPLMLSVMTLAYYEHNIPSLEREAAGRTVSQRLFDRYVIRMFQHRETNYQYSPKQTLWWLRWLSNRLLHYGQSLFLIEHLQPCWLQSEIQNKFTTKLLMSLWCVIYGFLGGVIFGMISGGIVRGLTIGISLGLIGILIDWGLGGLEEIKPDENHARKRLISSVSSMLFWGISSGVPTGISFGKVVGLMTGLSLGLIGGMVGVFRVVELNNSEELNRSNLISGLKFGILVGAIFGLFGALMVALFVGFDELNIGLFYGLSAGATVAIVGGLVFGLIFIPDRNIEISRQDVSRYPNQGIWQTAKYTMTVGPLIGLIVGLLVGILDELTGGIIFGFIFGYSFGATGGVDILIKHTILRIALWCQGSIPRNYSHFLDYVTNLAFLRKIGGGYISIHRLLLEHFASLTDADIERITAGLE